MEDGKAMNKLNVLYEDNHIIVVVKPFNVLSQKDSTNDISIMDIVKEYIKEKYHKPGNVYLVTGMISYSKSVSRASL